MNQTAARAVVVAAARERTGTRFHRSTDIRAIDLLAASLFVRALPCRDRRKYRYWRLGESSSCGQSATLGSSASNRRQSILQQTEDPLRAAAADRVLKIAAARSGRIRRPQRSLGRWFAAVPRSRRAGLGLGATIGSRIAASGGVGQPAEVVGPTTIFSPSA
jgi:hypothetical protein